MLDRVRQLKYNNDIIVTVKMTGNFRTMYCHYNKSRRCKNLTVCIQGITSQIYERQKAVS